jgi:cytidylate kinase
MSVITLNGMVGTGAPEIGAKVASQLGLDYVDRLILAEAGRRMGATVEAVADKTERPQTLSTRLSSFFRNVLERSAVAGTGSDPYFSPGLDALLVREYRELSEEPITSSEEIDDAQMLEVITSVVQDLARENHSIIIGRGANIILNQWPGALHVGLISSLERRVQRIVERERMELKDAERYVADTDRARRSYFQRFFKAQPQDSQHYHLLLNTDLLDFSTAAGIVAHAAERFVGGES